MKHANIGDQFNSNHRVGLHWFEPFGTTEFKNIVSMPGVSWAPHAGLPLSDRGPSDSTRVIFWDQEPVHRYRFHNFISPFLDVFKSEVKRLVTSEYDSEDVQWACDTYGLTSDYYFFHGWAALDWYRGYNRTSLAQPFAERKPYNTFLCPNNIFGGERRHRIDLLNQFVSHRIDLWEQANNSLIQVVTETAYNGKKQHLTEKSFKPIVMQQPFILQSCKGSLEYLRRYGFKTFGEFWDESYDEFDDDRRTEEIGKLLFDINTMSQKEKASLQNAVSKTVEYNYQWFYGEQFEKVLWNELNEMTKQW